MAAKIKEDLNLEAEFIRGGGGVYDIRVNDELVYSKHGNSNQFPESDEAVIELINSTID